MGQCAGFLPGSADAHYYSGNHLLRHLHCHRSGRHCRSLWHFRGPVRLSEHYHSSALGHFQEERGTDGRDLHHGDDGSAVRLDRDLLQCAYDFGTGNSVRILFLSGVFVPDAGDFDDRGYVHGGPFCRDYRCADPAPGGPGVWGRSDFLRFLRGVCHVHRHCHAAFRSLPVCQLQYFQPALCESGQGGFTLYLGRGRCSGDRHIFPANCHLPAEPDGIRCEGEIST